MDRTRYIILFKDGSIKVRFRIPSYEDYQTGSRLFAAETSTTMNEIIEWFSTGYQNTKTIQETQFL